MYKLLEQKHNSEKGLSSNFVARQFGKLSHFLGGRNSDLFEKYSSDEATNKLLNKRMHDYHGMSLEEVITAETKEKAYLEANPNIQIDDKYFKDLAALKAEKLKKGVHKTLDQKLKGAAVGIAKGAVKGTVAVSLSPFKAIGYTAKGIYNGGERFKDSVNDASLTGISYKQLGELNNNQLSRLRNIDGLSDRYIARIDELLGKDRSSMFDIVKGMVKGHSLADVAGVNDKATEHLKDKDKPVDEDGINLDRKGGSAEIAEVNKEQRDKQETTNNEKTEKDKATSEAELKAKIESRSKNTLWDYLKGISSGIMGIGSTLLSIYAFIKGGKVLDKIGDIGKDKGSSKDPSKPGKLGGKLGLAATVAGAAGLGYINSDSDSALGTAANVLEYGSLAAAAVSYGPAVLSGIEMLAGGILAMNPVTLAIGGIAAAGTGVYMYFNQVSKQKTTIFRMAQYGFREEDSGYFGKILELEKLVGQYLINRGGVYDVDTTRLDYKGIAEIFDLGKANVELNTKFTRWFNYRFRPVYLTHMTALARLGLNKNGILGMTFLPVVSTSSLELKDIDVQDDDVVIRFMRLVKYEEGPYLFNTSPFEDLSELLATNADRDKAYDDVVKGLDENKKKPVDKGEYKNSNPKVEGQKAYQKTEDEEFKKNLADYFGGKKSEKSVANNLEAEVKVNTPGISSTETTSHTSGSIPVDTKPVIDDPTDEFVKPLKDVDFDDINSRFKDKILGMSSELGAVTGKSLTITSAFRTRDKQQQLYNANPTKAAPPGKSTHEYGLAIDADSATLDIAEKLGLMRKYGLTRPIGGEPWHVEPAGIQTNVDLAKNDPNMAGAMIDAGMFKGGGGYGTLSGSRFGKRDPVLAGSLLSPSLGRQVKEQNDAKFSILGGAATSPMSSIGTFVANDTSSISVANPVAASEMDRSLSKDVNPSKENMIKVINKASEVTGVDSDIMLTMAQKESSLNPNARSRNSSASGLYQFIDSTWVDMVKKYGKKYGIDLRTPKTDPIANSLLAGEYFKENINQLRAATDDVGVLEVYLAHLLGPAGAKKLLKASDETVVANILPSAASSNPSILGKGMTVLDSKALIKKTLDDSASVVGVTLPDDDNVSGMTSTPVSTSVDNPTPSAEADASISSKIDKPVTSSDTSIPNSTPVSNTLEPIHKPIDSIVTPPVVPNVANTVESKVDNIPKRVDSAKTNELADLTKSSIDTVAVLRESLSVQKEMLNNLILIANNNNTSNQPTDTKETPDKPKSNPMTPLTRKEAVTSVPVPLRNVGASGR
jgi:hypothetical protein